MNRRVFLWAAGANVVLAGSASACIWDSDTLAMERERFPTVLELITGKFLRRSRDLYLWRITDRAVRLKKEPENFALLDDLAVAYDKTGQHDKAIALAKSMQTRKPGRYETEANLGTFHIHAGNREQGLKHIREALRINPDAHFGREKYQAMLLEYLLMRMEENDGVAPMPLAAKQEDLYNANGKPKTKHLDFAHFALAQVEEVKGPQEIAAAIKGVLGMMKFGDFESPVLLEALGDLLLHGGHKADAAQLAARAFLKASYHSKDGEVQANYRKRAEAALYATSGLPEIEAQFKRELEEARVWFAAVEANEKQWIAEGRDPDLAFERTYYRQPAISTLPEVSASGSLQPSDSQQPAIPTSSDGADALLPAAGAVLVAGLAGAFWWYKRRRLVRRLPK